MAGDPRVHNVTRGDLLVAQVFDFGQPGQVIFPTPETAEMQCGFGEVEVDKQVPAHVHNIVKRQTCNTSEFLYVIEGEVRIAFLDPEGTVIDQAVIGAQQGFLQYVGGHRMTIAAGTRYLELKQGPYFGHVKDKTVLNDDQP